MAIDLFSIGRFTVHGYGLMIGLGFLAAVFAGSYLAKRRNLSDGDFVNIAIYVLIIGFLGGKLLHIIVEFKTLLTDPMAVLGSEGFVVYGGIITAVMAFSLSNRYFCLAGIVFTVSDLTGLLRMQLMNNKYTYVITTFIYFAAFFMLSGAPLL